MADTKDDDWYLYTDDFDLNVSQRDRIDSTESIKQEHGDLFDDILTAPTLIVKKDQKEEDDEFMAPLETEEHPDLEDSGSARFKADLTARTVQARVAAGNTSQSVLGSASPYIYNEPNKKSSVFVGNLTWWTTDQDLLVAFSKVGFKTIRAVKFYENRSNGQSKGIALVELASETAADQACGRMAEIEIYDKHPILAYAMKTNLHQFEQRCKQDDPVGGVVKTTPVSSSNPGQTRVSNRITKPNNDQLNKSNPQPPGMGMPPMGHMHGGGGGPMNQMMPPHMPPMMGMRPGMPFPPPPGPPMMRPEFPMPGMQFPMGMPHRPVAPHVNPAFFPDMQSGPTNMMELFAQAAARLKNSSGMTAGMNSHSEEEIQEANQRNRAVSSSAIQRAMTDANSGDYESAIDILKMAISLIKQSITASTDASQILIQSLQDCLQSIERQSSSKKSSSRSSSSRYHDDRDRERSRYKERTSRHRDRSRERRR